jgi:hypothetical protein
VLQQCVDISMKIINHPKNATADYWANLLEECRGLWGTRPALVSASIGIAIAGRFSKRAKGYLDLFDGEQSVVERFRAAKRRRRDTGWWRDQLRKGADTSSVNRMVLLLGLFSFASTETIRGAAEVVEPVVEQLDATEWSMLASCVSIHQFVHLYEGGRQSNEGSVEFGSVRFAYLFALISNEDTARQIFMRHFLFIQEGQYNQFREHFAIKAAMEGQLEWDSALKIVREVYLRRDEFEFWPEWRSRTKAMPERIANEILSRPHLYPTDLWDEAETCATAKARRAVRAIGRIARDEKWFAA